MRRTGPGKRRADRVAAKTETGHVALPRVANLIGRDRHIPHSGLFALVDRRRAAKGEKQHGSNPRLLRSEPACHP